MFKRKMKGLVVLALFISMVGFFGCKESEEEDKETTQNMSDQEWLQSVYLKASNAGSGDYFGSTVAVDGDLMVISSSSEENTSSSINNTDNATIVDDSTANSVGAVYVYKRDASGDWAQDAYLKASNSETDDYFGYSLSIDGDYIVVGAFNEDNSSDSIVNTDNTSIVDDGTASNSGAVWAFKRDTSGDWYQDAYLKAPNSETDDWFGYSVDIEGSYIVVGAPREDNSSDAIDNSDSGIIAETSTTSNSGAVYIFKKDNGGNWIFDAYLKASNSGAGDWFGNSVSISEDYIAVGAHYEENGSTSIVNDDDAPIVDTGFENNSGAVYVFKKNGADQWVQDAYLKTSNTEMDDQLGGSVSISGSYIVVGAHLEDNSSDTIINSDNAAITDTATISSTGAAYVFKKDSASGDWLQDAYLKASNPEQYDQFGISVAISGDLIVVGAYAEDNSSDSLINDDGSSIVDEGLANLSGAAYIFKKDNSGNWIQDAYLKASNSGADDKFGVKVGIDSETIVVSANKESNSSSTIVNTDNALITDTGTGAGTGAAYIFTY